VQALYAPILATGVPFAYPADYALGVATQQQYRTQAQQVYALLQAHQQAYTQRSSTERFAFALQHARLVVQVTTYLTGAMPASPFPPDYYQRDNFMAENVEWLHDHASGPTPKMLIWAHDVQVANDTRYPSPDGKNLGGDLRAKYGSSYLPIGTTLYQGTFRAYDYPAGIVQALPPATSDTSNHALGQDRLPYYVLDLRTAPAGAVAHWASGTGPAALGQRHWASGTGSARVLLLLGLGGEKLDIAGSLEQYFDAIVHVQLSTPAQHL
jgi:erythromycin esterase-like protein